METETSSPPPGIATDASGGAPRPAEAGGLHDIVARAAARRPHQTALVHDGERLNYEEIDRLCAAFAAGLRSRGVETGDRVVIFSDNSTVPVIAFWGILNAGAVAVPVSPSTKAAKLAYLINDCQARALVTTAGLLTIAERALETAGPVLLVVAGSSSTPAPATRDARIEWNRLIELGAAAARVPEAPRGAATAAIIYTSGSTGAAKGVTQTHASMLNAARSISTYLEIAEQDVILNALPLSFDYGLYQVIMAFLHGARVVLERSFLYPSQLTRLLEREGVTGFPGVPAAFAILSEHCGAGAGFPAVRYVTNTAAALPPAYVPALERLFPNARIYSMYGLTECKRCSYLPPSDLKRKPTSVGIPIPGVNMQFWIIGEDGTVLPPGQIGQLVVRSDTMMTGYWGKPEETARALRPAPDGRGTALHTGDLCKLDDEGYLYVIGRMDDIIKSGGEKIAPREIENVISAVPGVKAVAVTGIADAVLGQAIKAYVVPAAGAELRKADILLACRAKLENYMIPKVIEIVADLPLSDNYKIKVPRHAQ